MPLKLANILYNKTELNTWMTSLNLTVDIIEEVMSAEIDNAKVQTHLLIHSYTMTQSTAVSLHVSPLALIFSVNLFSLAALWSSRFDMERRRHEGHLVWEPWICRLIPHYRTNYQNKAAESSRRHLQGGPGKVELRTDTHAWHGTTSQTGKIVKLLTITR